MALHYLGKGRILTVAQVAQATSIVGRDVSDDLGMERLLWLGGSEIRSFPYSREWTVKRAVLRKSKPCDL